MLYIAIASCRRRKINEDGRRECASVRFMFWRVLPRAGRPIPLTCAIDHVWRASSWIRCCTRSFWCCITFLGSQQKIAHFSFVASWQSILNQVMMHASTARNRTTNTRNMTMMARNMTTTERNMSTRPT